MHKGDEKWVRDKINELPTIELKQKAWQCYQDKYKSAWDDEPLDYKKENKARHAANSALRIYVEKVKEHIK